ncbi:MAG: zinc-dependent alcohol dehydrogenase family protein [Pseudomonadales bacterium]|nr:alcohol dehydrogenase [Acidiferrobacteraceae bacterium]MDP6375448.1 zinc-dependent alcohol dehydrogenase family protein [Pseudomonadales bacterium]MDP6470647.1 zinc-dependent alcohol dehydrogenase family protein [Pseudomonadales bacterium]MDP6828497.1 zinc-dependent alcohol dehydrogenase family protein [Pseudomonadales bacterium]MDP6970518.1 zinc-dependent alcohol dehydrogenase family protein [Pseudomonadales bacterium]
MKAMQLVQPGGAFHLVETPRPKPRDGEVLVKVRVCGVCRTDLHVVDGDLTDGAYPIVPGHQIVGEVVQANGVDLTPGSRVGIPWLGYTCGHCAFCTAGTENLCEAAEFTGYHRPGGFAEYTKADARFCFPLPETYDDLQVAPLLCAGLIGFRALEMTGEAVRIGFYGFGNAAHILTQIAVWQGKAVHAFTRDGDIVSQDFARGLGAIWAGGASDAPPQALDAAIIFAPVGALVPAALKQIRKGGVVVCAGIHMSDIPSFPYADLWGERTIRSVANLTRQDGRRLLELAPLAGVRTEISVYDLPDTAKALDDLRDGRIEGGAVIRVAGYA